MIKVTDLVRYGLTVVLLVIVWQNAHWSVALVLSLMALNGELQNKVIHMIREAAK